MQTKLEKDIGVARRRGLRMGMKKKSSNGGGKSGKNGKSGSSCSSNGKGGKSGTPGILDMSLRYGEGLYIAPVS